jgi:hypothetical protein
MSVASQSEVDEVAARVDRSLQPPRMNFVAHPPPAETYSTAGSVLTAPRDSAPRLAAPPSAWCEREPGHGVDYRRKRSEARSSVLPATSNEASVLASHPPSGDPCGRLRGERCNPHHAVVR